LCQEVEAKPAFGQITPSRGAVGGSLKTRKYARQFAALTKADRMMARFSLGHSVIPASLVHAGKSIQPVFQPVSDSHGIKWRVHSKMC
jgi:hypothetical protein